MRCRQCGGAMEVRFIGKLQDKRAVCSHCGTEVDLPDTFQRVQKKREYERSHWGSRTVEETVLETRQDGQLAEEDKSPLGWFFRGPGKKEQPDMLTPEEIIKLAGDPLPLAERRTCPNPRCGAVISENEIKCPWCSQALPAAHDKA